LPEPATEPDFWAAIQADPNDALPKLVFADWLDERGDVRGEGLRWLAEHGKRPACDTTGKRPSWDWWSRPPAEPDYYADSVVDAYVLPGNLFRRLKGKPTDIWKGYGSYRAALRDLGRAWAACVARDVDPLGNDP
jgi:uncharacterized protein (TIGR02996 family)